MASPVTARPGYLMKAAQNLFRQQMDDALRPVGLTTPQYAVLSALGEEPDLSGAALARRSFVTPQTMTGIVANLEKAGLIARAPHPVHGRIIRARLTETGAQRLAAAHGAVEGIEERMLSGLKSKQRLRLSRYLLACVTALEQPGGGGRETAPPPAADRGVATN